MIDKSFANKRIMFFSAHPDDEVAGAGGLIIKAKNNNSKLKFVLCIAPTEDRFDVNADEECRMRVAEYEKTAKYVNAESVCLNFDRYPELSRKHVLPIVKEIRDFKPDIIVMLSKDERHTEHKIINDLVTRAVWHASRGAFPELGQSHKTTTILESEGDSPMMEPDFLLDISEFIEEKKKLINGYDSQVQRKDLSSACAGLNAFRGLMYKCGTYAEAYKIKEFYYG